MANEIAPEGQVFVCGACGKRSHDRFGNQQLDYGWDESCMLNSVLCYAEKRLDEKGVLGWQAVHTETTN